MKESAGKKPAAMTLVDGTYVRHRKEVEWGEGRVLSIQSESSAVAFFMHGGRRSVASQLLDSAPTPDAETRCILDLSAAVDWHRAKHNLYVVELRPQVFHNQKFLERNLGYIPGARPCVYVGMTGLAPIERFRKHLSGIKSAHYVNQYGVRLCPPLYEHLNPLPYALAKEMECELARHLLSQGYGVWQN